ncbi:Palmitoyltransferase akr1 [Trichinella pseudospiralis]
MSQAVSKAILNDNSIGQKIKLSCHIGVARLTCTVACKNRQVPKTNADQKDDNKTAVAAERKSNIHRRNIPNSTMVGRQNCISVSRQVASVNFSEEK